MASIQAWGQSAVFEKGRPAFQVSLTYQDGKSTLTIANSKGKQVWKTHTIQAGEGDFGFS